jgi:hypothetical protein
MAVLPVDPYPTVATVMNLARAMVNDSYQGGAGRILTNQKPFTVQYLNSALWELQEKIRNNGVITLTRDNVVVGPIPALDAPDPRQQIKLTYHGLYVNGAWIKVPFLPGDLRVIQRVWEREVGSGLPFTPMKQPMEGLPSVYQGPWLRYWEWREDAICMVGSTQVEELRLRYTAQLPVIGPDIVDAKQEESWATTEINILSSENVLASLVAYKYALARGAQGAPAMGEEATRYMRLITNKYVRQAQRIRYQRGAYGETYMSNSSATNKLPA